MADSILEIFNEMTASDSLPLVRRLPGQRQPENCPFHIHPPREDTAGVRT